MATAETLASYELLGPLKPSNDSLPNHLTETRIFTHIQDHHSVKARPKAIHFEGYKVGKLHQQTLRLVNSSTDCLSLHVVPPTTRIFKISYSKERSRLVVGLSLDITVQFKPEQWKYYYDCIRIHCKGDENLIVPIHAYPAMDTSTFPRSVTFPPTPVGQSKTHSLSLECDIPMDFEYELTYEQTNPAFSVAPLKGIVPGSGKTIIKVTFSPTEFSTAIMKLKLEVSQFNSKPLFCTFTGTSSPGLAVEQFKLSQNVSAKASPPVSKKASLRQRKKIIPLKEKSVKSGLTYEGVWFPSNLYTPSAVAQVLSQEAGKMKVSQLKRVVSSGGVGGSDSRQLKETVFLQRVREWAEEEKNNKLRWVTHLGNNPMTNEKRERILEARQESHKIYQIKRHVADIEEACNQFLTLYSNRRTRRVLDEEQQQTPAIASPVFDVQSNNTWKSRLRAAERFIAAVRKTVIRNRCSKRLEKLRVLSKAMKDGTNTTPDSLYDKSKSSLPLHKPSLSLDRLQPYVFPRYEDSSTAMSLPLMTTPPVPVLPTQINTTPHLPLMDLRVPEMYKMLGYSKFLVPSEDDFALPDITKRPLLTGAEDEYQGLTLIPGVDPRLLTLDQTDQSKQREMKEQEADTVLEDIEETGVVPLVPPPSVFKAEDLMHEIHNPSPGVIDSLRPMIQNSEVTFEHILLPLPSPTIAPHPQPKIDPEDGIPGVMKWKQFQSPYLSSCEERPELVLSWRPRLNDPYHAELLPLMPHPHQLAGPQDDDLVDESIDNIPELTDDMIKKEFFIPSPNEGAFSQKTECEYRLLEDQKKKLNRLGKQHEEKYRHFISSIISQ